MNIINSSLDLIFNFKAIAGQCFPGLRNYIYMNYHNEYMFVTRNIHTYNELFFLMKYMNYIRDGLEDLMLSYLIHLFFFHYLYFVYSSLAANERKWRWKLNLV